jgi:hypothetical protein
VNRERETQGMRDRRGGRRRKQKTQEDESELREKER